MCLLCPPPYGGESLLHAIFPSVCLCIPVAPKSAFKGYDYCRSLTKNHMLEVETTS